MAWGDTCGKFKICDPQPPDYSCKYCLENQYKQGFNPNIQIWHDPGAFDVVADDWHGFGEVVEEGPSGGGYSNRIVPSEIQDAVLAFINSPMTIARLEDMYNEGYLTRITWNEDWEHNPSGGPYNMYNVWACSTHPETYWTWPWESILPSSYLRTTGNPGSQYAYVRESALRIRQVVILCNGQAIYFYVNWARVLRWTYLTDTCWEPRDWKYFTTMRYWTCYPNAYMARDNWVFGSLGGCKGAGFQFGASPRVECSDWRPTPADTNHTYLNPSATLALFNSCGGSMNQSDIGPSNSQMWRYNIGSM